MLLLLILTSFPASQAASVDFPPSLHTIALNLAFPPQKGRTGQVAPSLEETRQQLAFHLESLLASEGWVPARDLARALSHGVDWAQVNRSLVATRGPLTACHAAPVCLDLACGRCYDPLTSMHGDCGSLSYFRCTDFLPPACLPWTCSPASSSEAAPHLRNFLPRAASCSPSQALQLVSPAPEQPRVSLESRDKPGKYPEFIDYDSVDIILLSDLQLDCSVETMTQ